MWNRIDNLLELLSKRNDTQAINLTLQLKQKYKTQIDNGFKFTTICEDEILDVTAIYSDDHTIYEHLFINTPDQNLSNKYVLSSLIDEMNFLGVDTVEKRQKITISDVESKKEDTPIIDVHLYMQPKIDEKDLIQKPPRDIYLIAVNNTQHNDIYLIGYEKGEIKDLTYMINLKNNHTNNQITKALQKNMKILDNNKENTDYPLKYNKQTLKYRILKHWDDRYEMLHDGYENINKIIRNHENTYKTHDIPQSIEQNKNKITKKYTWGKCELKKTQNSKYKIEKIEIKKNYDKKMILRKKRRSRD